MTKKPFCYGLIHLCYSAGALYGQGECTQCKEARGCTVKALQNRKEESIA